MADKASDKKENEINLTYETLFELSRREKNRPELQKLEKSFFADFVNYLSQKKGILEGKSAGDFYSQSEKQKVESQVYNIRKMMKELYDRREKKIVDMAVIRAKTGGKVFETNLSDEEKLLFEELSSVMLMFRENILSPLMDGAIPETKDLKINAIDSNLGEIGQNAEISTEKGKKADKNTIKVEFLAPVPEFVGLDLEEYGPFNEKDVFSLPKEIADVLIQNKAAKIVE